MRLLAAFRALAIGSFCAALAAEVAQAQPAGGWQVVAQGAYSVARITTGGAALSGMAVTCEHTTPVLALSLGRAPARNPAQLTLSSGGASANLALVRNGATNVWVAGVRDGRVMDMLARNRSVDVAIDASVYGSVPLEGLPAAMRTALSGCYAPAAAQAQAAPPPTRAPTASAPTTSGAAPAGTALDAVSAAEPMAAAIIALAPAPGQRPPTPAKAMTLAPDLRRGGTYDFTLGELDVQLSGGPSITFTNAPVARLSTVMKSRPYDVLGALRRRADVTLRPILCTLAEEGNRNETFAVTVAGKAPFWISVTNWTVHHVGENYVLSVDVTYAPPPTARSLLSEMEEQPPRCPA